MASSLFPPVASAAVAAIALMVAAGVVAYADALPRPGVPDSCGIQLKTHNFTVETLDHVHRLGFRIVRRGFYWKTVEQQKGVYDFSAYDAQMAHARELGLIVVGTLFSGNPLYGEDRGGVLTEEGRAGFASFAAAAAKHYKDQHVLWEVWNEPNVRTFWRKDGTHNSEPFAAEYTALVKATVPAMLAADPDAFVMAGSVSNYWEPSYQWTEFCFRGGILESGIKGWSVHPYGVKTPEEFGIGHARTRELLRKYGAPDMPLLDTERGFAVKESEEGWSGGSPERAREFQAWHFVRQFLVDQMHGVALTFRVVDGTGQTLQFKTRLAGTGAWEPVAIPLDRKLEHWDGANDGKVHFPITALVLSVPKPREGEVKGKVEYAGFAVAGGSAAPVSAPPTAPPPSAAPRPAARATAGAPAAPAAPAGGGDLKLFEAGAQWAFERNTGQGSFTLGTADDGRPVGVLAYDFTAAKAKGTPYVLAVGAVNIPQGPSRVTLQVRAEQAQRLTFRVVDSTDQTHQFKTRVGAGAWEGVSIPLDRKLEHWGGAADGTIHYPITKLIVSVPKPEGAAAGKVELSNAATTP